MIGGKLTDTRTLQFLLQKAGVKPQRSAGQNFLICDEVVEATLASLRGGFGRQAAPNYVTELGAGVGTLTQALAAQGFYVRAIERDESLVNILQEQLPKKLRERVEIVNKDLRDVDWAQPSHKASAGDKAYSLVGNIPYNLSGFIIRKITQLEPAPEAVVLLVQQEVAERMTAAPPAMNLLGLAVQLWGRADRLLSVPRSCFWPEPEVDSSLVVLTPHKEQGLMQAEREKILGVAKKC
ncbi:MAG: rRNA adenine dimethyltransferase family protein, partial [Patescibacteria group bacterium]